MTFTHGCRPAALLVLVVASQVVAAGEVQRARTTTCPFEVAGVWRPETTEERNPIFLSFSPDGWVNLLERGGASSVRDFTAMAQVGYRLVSSPTSTRITFSTRRGNDVFPPGESAWEITEYGDHGFTALPSGNGEPLRWVRVETHRYFLTIVASPGVGTSRSTSAVMWTTLGGPRPAYEGFGMRAAEGAAASALLGRLPDEMATSFAREPKEGAAAMIRIELTVPEYHRTHQVLDRWTERGTSREAAETDPQRVMREFVEELLASLNQCSTRLAVQSTDATIGTAGADPGSQLPLEFVRRLRALNDGAHVPDREFPFLWEPPAVM